MVLESDFAYGIQLRVVLATLVVMSSIFANADPYEKRDDDEKKKENVYIERSDTKIDNVDVSIIELDPQY